MKNIPFKRILSAVLALVLFVSAVPGISNNAQAAEYTGIMHQTDSQWYSYYYNGGSLAATGCGIFSLANAVGYLTGYKMDVVEIADWAHRNGMYNVYGADGTYRTSFYPAASKRYGEAYGFTIDCSSDGSGYWSGAYSTLLKNHLAGGGTAVIHVYNHFMALVGYDPNSNKFHLYDCAPRDRRNTLANGGDLWFTEAQLSSGYTDIDWFCLVSPTAKDEEKPVISDVKYSNVSAAGYTVTCTVTDNQSIKRVSFPTWTIANGQDDLPAQFMATQQGTQNGNIFTFNVKASDHNNEGGLYVTHIYAEDRSGNVTTYHLNPVEVRNDTQNPVISDVQYSNLSSSGYTVTCTVTDDWGVSSVSFPTWTVANGQDDLPAQFLTTQLGTRNGNRFTFRVNTSDHNNETGGYVTHIYATDCAGNRVSLPLGTVQVMDDTEAPVITDAVVSNISAEGYTVTCTVTDNWGIHSVAFPTWTPANGQDDLAQDFFNTQVGTRNENTFTFEVKAADHNNETGSYITHIYATDCAGNRTQLVLDAVNVQDPVQIVVPEVTAKSFSLSFEDEILVNFYYAVSDMTNVVDHGMLVFNSQPAAVTYAGANAVYNESTYDSAKARYGVTTDGIAAKEMGDTRYYAAYAKLSDGSYVYSNVYDYSPKKYAVNMLGKTSTSDKQKALCVAMLNYGTAAQNYFSYNTGSLMNEVLTADQKALVRAYDASLFTGSVAASSSKIGSFAATATGFSKKSATVSFEGAMAINYYFTPSATISGSMNLYVWTPETYASVGTLTTANASEVIQMVDAGDGRYWADLDGIPAKALDETYYVAAVYTDASGNRYCTGVVAYSLSKYCINNAKDGKAIQELATAAAMYGYYAEAFFS